MRVWQRLTHLLLPPVCTLCGGPGQSLDEPWGLDLCTHCETACPRVAGACTRCGLPNGSPGAACGSCQASPPCFDSVICAFQYADPVDQLVTRLKFRHDLACARVLGTLLARCCRETGRRLPDCVVPLPLHASRYRERGFCQTTELARHLAPRLRGPDGRPLAVEKRLLRRLRATRAQSGLTASARITNLEGAFGTLPDVRAPAHVALLDDVMTTGSTLGAAARALKAAGALRVDVWCCARALREPEGTADPIC